MKKLTGIKMTRNVSTLSSYCLAHATIFYFIILLNRTKGDGASECYNCYSTDKEGCIEPYDGRYQYNSNILIPDCSFDMARNFHSSLMYVLTTDAHEATVTKVDETYIPKWDSLSDASQFFCCKALFQVTVASKSSRYVVRGCCCAPSSYDQCQETSVIIKNLSDLTPSNTSYNLEHCSICGTDRCNSSSSSIVHGFLATIFVMYVLKVASLNGAIT